jgi:hypothetical protein
MVTRTRRGQSSYSSTAAKGGRMDLDALAKVQVEKNTERRLLADTLAGLA